MRRYIYSTLIVFYYFLIKSSALFNRKAKNWLEVRKDITSVKSKLSGQKRIWLHASSVGEYEQGIPLLRMIKNTNVEISILVSFFSPSASLIDFDKNVIDQILYIPIDLRSKAKRFVESIDPDMVIFVKYDFWINHLNVCFEKSIPVFFISVRFRKNQFYFTIAQKFYTHYFKQMTHFFVQDKQTADLLLKSGSTSISICGDTRVDRVIKIYNQPSRIDAIERFLSTESCIVIGSCWESDLIRIVPFIKKNLNQWKWIIIPHDPKDHAIVNQIRPIGHDLTDDQLESTDFEISQKRILIVNRMGLLSNIYRYAKVAFVGGAFKGTLHNILEPAVFGIPVFFGKHANNQKFAEATDLIAGGGAFEFNNDLELTEIFNQIINDPVRYDEAAQASFDYVRSRKGATEIIFNNIYSYIHP
jgi:3-deoxy-D-manno-octulosonic-acid transferase